MTQPLRIRAIPAAERRGNLCAKIDDGNLLLPTRIVEVLAALDIRTAADLVSYLQAFPSSIAIQLGWDLADVSRALRRLRAQLKGRVHEDILNPAVRREPPYGALDPSNLVDRKTNGKSGLAPPFSTATPHRPPRATGAHSSRRGVEEPDKGK
jgi:hypothetical protein